MIGSGALSNARRMLSYLQTVGVRLRVPIEANTNVEDTDFQNANDNCDKVRGALAHFTTGLDDDDVIGGANKEIRITNVVGGW